MPKKLGMMDEEVINVQVEGAQLYEIPLFALFFSADWCPPCRGMLPILNNFYQKINAGDFTKGDNSVVPPKKGYVFKQSRDFVINQRDYIETMQELELKLEEHGALKKICKDKTITSLEAID